MPDLPAGFWGFAAVVFTVVFAWWTNRAAINATRREAAARDAEIERKAIAAAAVALEAKGKADLAQAALVALPSVVKEAIKEVVSKK